MMSTKTQLVVKLLDVEEDCSLPPVADYEENKTQEEEVCLDERLVAAQSACCTVSMKSW